LLVVWKHEKKWLIVNERTHMKMRQLGTGLLLPKPKQLDGGASLMPLQVSCIGAISHLVFLKVSADYVSNGLWLTQHKWAWYSSGTSGTRNQGEPLTHTTVTIMSTCHLPHCLIPNKRDLWWELSHCLIILSSHCLILAPEMKIWNGLSGKQESTFVLLVGIHLTNVVTLDSRDSSGWFTSIVGWLVKCYFHVQW
jgi:hypothetical protein